LGEQHNPEQCQGGPRERSSAVAAHRGDSEWPEELDGDGRAERDAFDRGEERDRHQSGGDTESEEGRHVGPAYPAQGRAR
jgi:hypothetical protein